MDGASIDQTCRFVLEIEYSTGCISVFSVKKQIHKRSIYLPFLTMWMWLICFDQNQQIQDYWESKYE